MKYVKFFLVGILFGIVMSKAEIISWYRIYEMFKFQSFHMYGIIGSAVAIGIVSMFCFVKKWLKLLKETKFMFALKKEDCIEIY